MGACASECTRHSTRPGASARKRRSRALRARYTHARALAIANKGKQALAILQPLVEELRQLGDQPLLSATLLDLCVVQNNEDAHAAAAETCTEAVRVALAAKMDSDATRA